MARICERLCRRFFHDLVPDCRRGQFLPKYENHTTASLGEGFKLAAWHLQMIGVKPELQRRGVGSELIDAVHKKVCLQLSLALSVVPH